eukprot:6411027-Prymnesium_polylepis.1
MHSHAPPASATAACERVQTVSSMRGWLCVPHHRGQRQPKTRSSSDAAFQARRGRGFEWHAARARTRKKLDENFPTKAWARASSIMSTVASHASA